MVHAGTHPDWSVKKTLALPQKLKRIAAVRLRRPARKNVRQHTQSLVGKLKGYKRLRFIINCLTRMRMITHKQCLNFSHTGSPWRARKNLRHGIMAKTRGTKNTRVVFGHWSQLGLIVLPKLISWTQAAFGAVS